MVETIEEAWQLGWRITARCAFGNNDGMRSIRSCVYQYDLGLRTLIWTRGAAFPLSDPLLALEVPELRIAAGRTRLPYAERTAEQKCRQNCLSDRAGLVLYAL